MYLPTYMYIHTYYTCTNRLYVFMYIHTYTSVYIILTLLFVSVFVHMVCKCSCGVQTLTVCVNVRITCCKLHVLVLSYAWVILVSRTVCHVLTYTAYAHAHTTYTCRVPRGSVRPL